MQGPHGTPPALPAPRGAALNPACKSLERSAGHRLL